MLKGSLPAVNLLSRVQFIPDWVKGNSSASSQKLKCFSNHSAVKLAAGLPLRQKGGHPMLGGNFFHLTLSGLVGVYSFNISLIFTEHSSLMGDIKSSNQMQDYGE